VSEYQSARCSGSPIPQLSEGSMEAIFFPAAAGYGKLPFCKANVQLPKLWWVLELSSMVTLAVKI
jgi:hypothetical protein